MLGHKRYPYLALLYSQRIASLGLTGCHRSWYSETNLLLQSINISIDQLPPFRYSLDTPPRLLSSKDVINKAVINNIDKQYILDLSPTTSWPQNGLLCRSFPTDCWWYDHRTLLSPTSLVAQPEYSPWLVKGLLPPIAGRDRPPYSLWQ